MNRYDANPLVHGYLYLWAGDESPGGGWHKEFTSFCTGAGYRLGSIFIDHAGSLGSFARGGFIELLAALRVPGTHAVVVPSRAHLSTDAFLQQVLTQMVQMTSSLLLVSADYGHPSRVLQPAVPGSES